MMLKEGAREYEIDLCEAEKDRWAHVIESETATANRLAEEAMSEIAVGKRSRRAASWAFEKLYSRLGGRYGNEMAACANAIGMSSGEVTALNCSYELGHLLEHVDGMRVSVFGCTAGIRWLPGIGMVHLRNMDWGLSAIGDATRLFRFVDGGREFYSVGIVGFVGVLSGMVPGAYSVSINWAPPVGRPTFDFGPSFLVREVLETCDSYMEAVEVLTSTNLSTPVFFTVCGTTKSQGCVIERRRKRAHVRRIRGGVITQANHHVARGFRDRDDYWDGFEEDLEDSRSRASTLRAEMMKLTGTSTLETASRCLGVEPVLNEVTMQQMAFAPASGQLNVWHPSLRCSRDTDM